MVSVSGCFIVLTLLSGKPVYLNTTNIDSVRHNSLQGVAEVTIGSQYWYVKEKEIDIISSIRDHRIKTKECF